MKRFASTIAVLSLAVFATANIQINTPLKDGDKIAGIVELRATVVSDQIVNQVEFYVNGNLRMSDRSTPYRYNLDTIPEREGPIEIEIAAYTADGNSNRIKLNLVVDNEIAKGAAAHTTNAVGFLQTAKWDEAIQAARVALKADENHTPAKLAMARAYMGKNEFDNAQKWAEDAVISEDTVEGSNLLAGIHVERAFRIVSMSGERGDAMKQIAAAFKAAVAQRTAAVDMRLKALGAVNDNNRLEVVDLLIRRHDYSAARRHLLAVFDEVNPDLAIGNRLIYATLRSGRMEEAYRLADNMQKKSVVDSTTWSLLAAGHGIYRQWDRSSEALRNGSFDDPDSPSLMSAAAYVAIIRNDLNAARSQINRMISENISTPEVQHYLSVMQFMTGQVMESRDSFRKAIVQEPLLLDAYVERAYQALMHATRVEPGLDRDRELILEQAKEFFETALAVKPDSPEALNGLAIVHMYLKDNEESLRMAEAAVAAGPEHAWTRFTLAAALNANRRYRDAQRATDEAGAIDKVVLQGRGVPLVDEAWNYTWRFARQPVIIPPR